MRVETAGGGASEPDASLPALDRAATEALRREIEGARREPPGGGGAGAEVLRRLSTRDLLLAGATSGQIGVALSLLAVGSQVFDEFFSEAFLRNLVESLAPNALMVALILVPAVALPAWLLAIAGTVLAHSGFTLSREGDFLYIKRGLLERREATIPLARIQAVRISEGLLRQPFGLASLRVESAGYGEDAGVSTILFPASAPRRGPGAPAPRRPPSSPSPRRSTRCRAAPCGATSSGPSSWPWSSPRVALASFLVFDSTLGLLAVVLVPPFALYGWLRFRDAGWALADDRLVVRSRGLARVTVVAPRRRLQSRSVPRTPSSGVSGSPPSGRGRLRRRRFGPAVTDLDAGAAETLAGNLGPRGASA